MKKNLLIAIPLAGVVGMSFLYKNDKIEKYHNDGIESVDFSADPLPAKTGAPGEGNCTDCHSGTTLSAEGVVDFTLSGGPSYIPGDTYPITVSTVGGAKNGFELTIFDSDNNQVGTFTGGANSNVIESDGKEYVRHSSSIGETSWTFSWEAPATVTGTGELTAYYSMAKTNNNGSTSGDEIFLGNTTITQEGVGIQEDKLDQAYKVYFNAQARTLNLNYALLEDAKVVLNIQDLSGRLVEYYDFGVQTSGDYSENLEVTKVQNEGVYIISLFVNNRVFNRKVMLN